MANKGRETLATAIGWMLIIVVAIWAFGMLIGWIHFVLRSVAWLVLIALLVGAYLTVKGPPGD